MKEFHSLEGAMVPSKVVRAAVYAFIAKHGSSQNDANNIHPKRLTHIAWKGLV